ncbi:carboxymuconolactone decarboxylase family protein [Paraburkholderia sediminicola]|uniref:carboxymuconolactone decarboxylase family protein n=1 Tax=Paraburkholderia sediminicola TaxID=458836 RepID=UPI0014152117
MSNQWPQRIPYPLCKEGEIGVYGPITNGQRIARHLAPDILAGIGAQSGALLHRGTLRPSLREMIIVRIGYHTGSAYEVYQHRSLALSLGVPEIKLDALACINPDNLEESERVAILFVDELLTRNRPTDDVVAALRARFSDGQVLEIIAVTGNWWMLAKMLETSGVPLDEEAIGERGKEERK